MKYSIEISILNSLWPKALLQDFSQFTNDFYFCIYIFIIFFLTGQALGQPTQRFTATAGVSLQLER